MQIKGYTPLEFIDGGTFSSVYKTQSLSSDKQIYAVKVLNQHSKSDSNIAFYREIQALSIADHPNIMKLHEVVKSPTNTCLITEFIPYNMGNIVKQKPLPESIVKGYMVMLLRGLAHLHELGIIHRDIKPQNCFVTSEGVLKIGDLGLCRVLPEKFPQRDIEENHNWTLQVGTHYYRAPELLLGDRGYSKSIDIWSAGCVLAELLNGEPLFPGIGDFELLKKISMVLGSPDEAQWPGITQLPDFGKIMFKERAPTNLHELFPTWDPLAIDLFSQLVRYEPNKRISARQALHHQWFQTEPLPCIVPYDGNNFDFMKSKSI